MTFVRRYVETPRGRRGAAILAVLLTGGLVAAASSVGGGLPFGGSTAEEPDLILVNGELLTIDPQQPRARAIAITDDEITAVGSSRSVSRLAGRGTQTINLRGRTVITNAWTSDCRAASQRPHPEHRDPPSLRARGDRPLLDARSGAARQGGSRRDGARRRRSGRPRDNQRAIGHPAWSRSWRPSSR